MGRSPWSSRNWVSGFVMVNLFMVCPLSWGKLKVCSRDPGNSTESLLCRRNSLSLAVSGLHVSFPSSRRLLNSLLSFFTPEQLLSA